MAMSQFTYSFFFFTLFDLYLLDFQLYDKHQCGKGLNIAKVLFKSTFLYFYPPSPSENTYKRKRNLNLSVLSKNKPLYVF